jgi:hypothetical protein
MTKLKMARVVAASASGLVLSLGVVGMASAHQNNWQDTSSNDSSAVSSVKNDNDVSVKNDNDQKATSGKAEIEHNKDGGNATTGVATNGNATGITVGVTNAAPKAQTPQSPDAAFDSNSSTVKTTVKNDNDVKVTNNNDQKATSGNAVVEHNENAGNATTGNAGNTNATTIAVTVGN